MARFKQVPQNYLLRKLMEFWINTVRNYNGPVRDDLDPESLASLIWQGLDQNRARFRTLTFRDANGHSEGVLQVDHIVAQWPLFGGLRLDDGRSLYGDTEICRDP